MARHHAADDYEDDPEEPDESDMDADDEGDDPEETPRRAHPRWVIATAVLLLLFMLYALLKWWL